MTSLTYAACLWNQAFAITNTMRQISPILWSGSLGSYLLREHSVDPQCIISLAVIL